MIRASKGKNTLQKIVEENGGGNFVASVFIRSDGFLVQLNCSFLDRIARGGKLDLFCEELKKSFSEVVDDAKKESNRSGAASGGTFSAPRVLSGV